MCLHRRVDAARLYTVCWILRHVSESYPGMATIGLVVHFGSSHTYSSSGQLQGLALCPAITHARDQGIEIGAGELPLERMSNALEVALEVRQSFGDCHQAREVVGGQHLALDDREVDFDLVEPTCMDRSVDRNQCRVGLREAAYRRRTTM